MTRKTIGLILISSLFILACAGVSDIPGLAQPTPTALPMPTDLPQAITTPTAETGGADVTATPEEGSTETPTDEPTDEAAIEEPTDEAAVEEPTDAPDLLDLSADEVPNIKILKELNVPGANVIAVSPDSDLLASAEGNTIVLYDMPWPAGVTKLTGHSGKVNSVSWGSDDTQLVSGSDDGTVRTWDASTGKEVAKYDIDSSPVLAVTWSPDGALIAAGTRKGVVKILDAETGAVSQTITASKAGVALGAITWSSDGSQLATALYQGATNPGDIQLWDATDGSALDGGKNAKSYTAPGPTGIAWSPLDDIVAWVSNANTGQVSLWTIDDDKNSVTFNDQSKVHSIAWGPEGDMIASGGEDHMIDIWDATDGTQLVQLKGCKDTVNTVAWAPDGTFLVSASADGVIRIWGSPDTTQ